MNFYEAKFLCDYILQKEIKNNNLNVKPYTFGVISYYNQEYFKSKIRTNSFVLKHPDFSLKEKIKSFISATKYSLLPSYKGIYSDSDNSIVIFIDNLIVLPKIKINIIDLLKTTYHEIYHAIDFKNKTESFDFNNYDKFSCDLERFLSKHYTAMPFKYLFNHDSFMIEILANKYGIEKTIQYIKENPLNYTYDINRLSKLKNKYDKQYNNYNLSKYLEIIIKNYKDVKKCKDFDDTIFTIFINEDGTIKSLNEVLVDPKVKVIDKKIFGAFLNTPTLKKAFNMTEEIKKKIDSILNTQKEEIELNSKVNTKNM